MVADSYSFTTGSRTEHAAGTLKDLVEPYLGGRLRRHEITRLTAKNDRAALKNFTDAIPGLEPGDLAAGHVKDWLESLEHLAPATRRRRYSTVRTFCGWLTATGQVAKDPTFGIKSPKQPRSVPRAMRAADVTRVLNSLPDTRAVLIVTWMVQLGLRCCEMARLQLGDIDAVGGMVRIRGKGGHERILPIVDEAADALEEYLRGDYPGGAGPLIRSHLHPGRGLDPDTISGLVSEWMRQAGVKRQVRDGISAHALRHTMASDSLRGGAHLRDVQQALGHAHLTTTEIYLPLVVHGLAKAMGGRTYRR